MARVVQQRMSPYLYVVVIFVILFLISTALAVVFYNMYAGARKDHKELTTQYAGVADGTDLKDVNIRKMQDNFKRDVRKARTKRGFIPKTAVRQLKGYIDKLSADIRGETGTFRQARIDANTALEEAKESLEQVNLTRDHGLADIVSAFHREIRVKTNEVGSLNGVIAQLTQQLKDATKNLEDARTDFRTKMQEKDAKIRELDGKFKTLERDTLAKLEQAKKEYQDSVGALQKNIATQTTQIQTLQGEVKRWKKRYEREIKQVAKPAMDTERPSRRADGKILSVLSEEGLVYINIGAAHRVTEDLHLTVYPYTGIPDSGAGKAVIQVTNVNKDTSECRILRQDKENPVIPGDLVANLVYSALRTYNFVVEGQFDPDNTGIATVAGNKAVKDLIQRYGGRVMKNVTIDTDYVILGEAPARPRKPDDTDPGGAWDLYQERMKTFKRYQDIKGLAQTMQVPTFNGKRFLDQIGYVPAKPAPK